MLQAAQIAAEVDSAFEAARQSPGAPYDPDRFLAFLTDPPAAKGSRVRDTFAGRQRFVRFMHRVQLDHAICFNNEEWEAGPPFSKFLALIEKKSNARASIARRLALYRLTRAKGDAVFLPLAYCVALGAPTLALSQWLPRPVAVLPWVAWTYGLFRVLRYAITEVTYHRALIVAIDARAS